MRNVSFTGRDEVLRKTRLHLDASRSAALFAERVLLVEGVTDAAIVREFGWVWAGADLDKQAFIDALSIVPMGTKVGPWAPRLLATRGHEVCNRIAVLRDSDVDFEAPIPPVSWAAEHDDDVLHIEHNHPTLEPAITTGNEALIAGALSDLALTVPADVSPEAVHELFRSARAGKDGAAGTPAGPGAARKGEFALAVATRLAEHRADEGRTAALPEHLDRLFEFLYSDGPAGASATTDIGDLDAANASLEETFHTDLPEPEAEQSSPA